MAEIIRTENLQYAYPADEGAEPVLALKGVDLTIEQGSFVVVLGHNGSGKSTLLHMLGGLDRPTSGTVTVDGKDIFALKDETLTIFRRRKIAGVVALFKNHVNQVDARRRCQIRAVIASAEHFAALQIWEHFLAAVRAACNINILARRQA